MVPVTVRPQLAGVAVRAEHLSAIGGDWRLTQTGGPDLADGRGYTNRELSLNDGRFGRTVLFTREVNATLKTLRGLPIVWKTGLKTRQQIQKFEDDQLAKRFDYVGGAASGAWAPYPSPWPYDLGMNGGGITSRSGGNVFMPNLRELAELYRAKPGDFRQNWGTNGDNFYESFPNIYTLRGTQQRKALEYVDSLNKVLALKPEIVFPSHGEPIVGAEKEIGRAHV